MEWEQFIGTYGDLEIQGQTLSALLAELPVSPASVPMALVPDMSNPPANFIYDGDDGERALTLTVRVLNDSILWFNVVNEIGEQMSRIRCIRDRDGSYEVSEARYPD